ncbi:MAG TPA: glutamate 5-kinase [Actinomycetota bacterium]|jgi:glutamate 5-kinase|nr:glutamate 5-kinase [Actinomycetota bacterium]
MSRAVRAVRRLVVKVGTSSLVDDRGRALSRKLAKVARDVASVRKGRDCVLVSSGAIASGLGPMGLSRRPRDIPGLQAAAAVGQGRLMAEYAQRFARRGVVTAQVLLTQEDFLRRRHFINARNTFERLMDAGIVPVVNENDTVATSEISFGDNDRLAALVAILVRADLLVLLSDVDGIYTRDPRRGRARLLGTVTDVDRVEATGPGTDAARGGMASKLEAAAISTAAGVGVVVAGAHRRDVLARILGGEPVGTWLPPRGDRPRARKAWLAYASGVRGRILVDGGAERAVREDGRSLLAAGVVGVEGRFSAGDPVEVAGPSGRPFARGLVNYASEEMPRLAGRSTDELTTLPGGPYDGEVIHRDELVVMPR